MPRKVAILLFAGMSLAFAAMGLLVRDSSPIFALVQFFLSGACFASTFHTANPELRPRS